MKSVALKIAYKGTNFSGWQIQKNSRTIQEEVQKAFNKANISFSNFHAATRTDAGVHANGQIVSVHLDTSIPTEKIPLAINQILDKDIKIIQAYNVASNFHARYYALAKRYNYFINFEKIESPFRNEFSWHYPYPINLTTVNKSVNLLIGKHNFKAFQKTGSSVKDTVREIYNITAIPIENGLKLEFIGNGFLYNMVRILTGTIIQTASNIIPFENIEKALETHKREWAGVTAPAQGLFLDEIFYDQNKLNRIIKNNCEKNLLTLK